MRFGPLIPLALLSLSVRALSEPRATETILHPTLKLSIDACLKPMTKFCVDAMYADHTARNEAPGQTSLPHVHRAVLDQENRLPQPPAEIDLHSIDSRCNPSNMSETQRFNGKGWVHLFTCPRAYSCKDVQGIGACEISPGVYLTKAANETTILDPSDSAPIRQWQKCNPLNDTEVLTWNGTAYAADGVCLPPYVCYDFRGEGFCFCARRDIVDKEAWLPWRTLVPPPSMIGNQKTPNAITRCANKTSLEEWTGMDWEHYRDCTDPWECRADELAPYNGGCFSPGAAVAHAAASQSHQPPSAFRSQKLSEGLHIFEHVYGSTRVISVANPAKTDTGDSDDSGDSEDPDYVYDDDSYPWMVRQTNQTMPTERGQASDSSDSD